MNSESHPTSSVAPAVGGLPTIHDDELLYSIVARFGWMTGYPDAASANLDLFGRAFGHAASRSPANLDAMARRLPTNLGFTGRDLALKHTLLPYHCAFLPEHAEERAIAAAIAEGGRKGRPVGAFEKPLNRPRKLRFCPDCIATMIENDYDLHWKRVHQLAIVVVCPEHGGDLRESEVRPDTRDRSVQPANLEVCNPSSPPLIPPGAEVDREALVNLARDARTVLGGEYPAGMTRKSGPEYALLFRDLGYRRRSRVDWEKIVPALQDAVAMLAPALPGVATIGSDPMGWFALSMAPDRPGHADRVLIASMVARRIAALEPRFWAVFDHVTREPLMTLDAA